MDGLAQGHGSRLASAVQESLERHGVTLSGTDLGGTQSRGVWLDSSSGRLIVRSASSQPIASIDGASASCIVLKSRQGEVSQWLPPVWRDATA